MGRKRTLHCLKLGWSLGLCLVWLPSLDLSCRKVIEGTEPFIRYHYSQSGNYTLRLNVGVNLNKYSPLITDSYAMDVQVLGQSIYDYYVGSLLSTAQNKLILTVFHGKLSNLCWRDDRLTTAICQVFFTFKMILCRYYFLKKVALYLLHLEKN